MKLNDLRQFKTLADLQAHLIAQGLAANKTEARKKAQAMIPKESKFQSEILKYLKTRQDVFAWKDQAGMYQSQGIPDIIAIKNGLFIGLEIKRPFFSTTSDIQKAIHDKIKSAGGRVFIVSYVAEVKEILDSL